MNTASYWFYLLIYYSRSLYRLDKVDLDLVLNSIDILNLLLKDNITVLIFILLSCLIEFGCLPVQRLMFETLSEDQILSRYYTCQSIAVLLWYSKDNVKLYTVDQPDPVLTLGIAGYYTSKVEQPAYNNTNSYLLDRQDSVSNWAGE